MKKTSQNKKQSQDSCESKNSQIFIYCYIIAYCVYVYLTKNTIEVCMPSQVFLRNRSLIILFGTGSPMGEKNKSGRFVAKLQSNCDL